MKFHHAAALGTIALVMAACTPVENHTDNQAAMARMTFSPEKCETVGAVYSMCGGEHALPDASAGIAESGKTNDTRLYRGFCAQGFHYEMGNGCQKD
jgi:hypothetical protein